MQTATQALGEGAQSIHVRAEMRYRGQSFELAVPVPAGSDPADLRESFASTHEERYGYRDEQAEVELVTLRVSAFGAAPQSRLAPSAGSAPQRQTRTVILDGRPVEALCLRGELAPGQRIEGPAICALPESTLLVPQGWSGAVDAQGTVVLARGGPS